MSQHQGFEQVIIEQHPQFDTFRDRWISVGKSTTPSDRVNAEEAIRKAYQLAGLTGPERFVWCGSPMALGLCRAILTHREFPETVAKHVWNNIKNASETDVRDSIKDSFSTTVRLIDSAGVKQELMNNVRAHVAAAMTDKVASHMQDQARFAVNATVWEGIWTSVWSSAWDLVWTEIGKSVQGLLRGQRNVQLSVSVRNGLHVRIGPNVKREIWSSVRDSAWNSIRDHYESNATERTLAWDKLWTDIRHSVWDNIAAHIAEQVRASGTNCFEECAFGQHDANWLAFYAYFREAAGLRKETEKLCGLNEVAQQAGWFLPHKHICWIAERPTTLHLDERGRLHSLAGPAIVYPDGWGIYAKNGALVYAINGSL